MYKDLKKLYNSDCHRAEVRIVFVAEPEAWKMANTIIEPHRWTIEVNESSPVTILHMMPKNNENLEMIKIKVVL